MSRQTIRAIGRIGLAGWVFSMAGYAASSEFSADVVRTIESQSSTGKMYVKSDKTRTELSMPGMTTIMIADTKKGSTIMLYPDRKMYMEMSGQKDAAAWKSSDEELAKIGAKRKELGAETVNNHECDKYEITYTDTSLGKMALWFSRKLEFPVKIVFEATAGSWNQELKNIIVGKVDDSVFQIPAGYSKMPTMPVMPEMPATNAAPAASTNTVETDKKEAPAP